MDASSHSRGSAPVLVEKEKRRLRAGRMFARGVHPAEVARRLGVSRQSASRWRALWKEQGQEGLRSTGPVGRPSALDAQQKRRLARELIRGPQAHGWKTDLWTLPRIAQLIRRLFGVSYHPGHVWRVVRALGFTPQKPERQARERDAQAVAQWLRRRWPATKKTAAAEGLAGFARRERPKRETQRAAHVGPAGPDADPEARVQLEARGDERGIGRLARSQADSIVPLDQAGQRQQRVGDRVSALLAPPPARAGHRGVGRSAGASQPRGARLSGGQPPLAPRRALAGLLPRAQPAGVFVGEPAGQRTGQPGPAGTGRSGAPDRSRLAAHPPQTALGALVFQTRGTVSVMATCVTVLCEIQ